MSLCSYRTVSFLVVILFLCCHGFPFGNYISRKLESFKSNNFDDLMRICQSSERVILKVAIVLSLCSTNLLLERCSTSFDIVPVAFGRNLPEDNGASGKMRGSIQSLSGIVQLKEIIQDAINYITNAELCIKKLNEAPVEEKLFKRIFDEYSEAVSYKQQYLDKNAFLVYYTKGFDGVGRESIESFDPSTEKMTLQYGYRNDAWIAFDEARSEADYLLHLDKKDIETKDLVNALTSALNAINNYLHLSPPDDLATAKSLLISK